MTTQTRSEAALVTGGTDGIGKEVARGLASAGCQVIVVGRDPAKGARAENELRQTTGNKDVRFLQADLSLMREADRLGTEIARHWPALCYLVHSAGIIQGRWELSEEGIERNFAVNYLSRFALTQRLLPLLVASGQAGSAARIVIAGGAAQNGSIFFDDVNLTRGFNIVRMVGQFCQANDVFTVELARRLAAQGMGSRVTINCLKIGVVKTNIRQGFPAGMRWLVENVFDPLIGQSPKEVADVLLELLLSPDYEALSGALYLKIKKFKQISAGAKVADLGARLWELSERLVASARDHGPMLDHKKPRLSEESGSIRIQRSLSYDGKF